jgi:uncharacterized phiE125 gp8 family phage protein
VLKVITAASQEPVTLADAKAFLRVDTDADDALISALVSAAREFAEHYAQVAFADTTYELALAAFPYDAINLPNARSPVVVSVKYTDTAGAEQTLNSSDYVLSDYGMQAYIYPPQSWPAEQATNISAAALAAILEMVAHLYENREDAGSVPPGVLRLLDVAKVYR